MSNPTKAGTGPAMKSEPRTEPKLLSEKDKLIAASVEIEDADEWVKECADTYLPGMHRGVSKKGLRERLAALQRAIAAQGHNNARHKHAARLGKLLA